MFKVVSNEQKAEKALSKQKASLLKAFDEQPEDINIFDPKKEGEFLIGKIADYGISKEYSTPFLILLDKNGDEITAFIKMGIIPKFHRKKLITKDDKWIEDKIDALIGDLIAFQYTGLAISGKSKREFQKYKVLFSDDLKELGITEL